MTRGPRRKGSLWHSSSLSKKRVFLKVQYRPTRCLQSQSLVTGKMLDTLKVPQDFMWAVCQNRNVFAAVATMEVARFSSRIRSSSGEEPTDVICSPHLLHFLRALWSHTTTGWLTSDLSALVSLVSTTIGRDGATSCPKCWRTASNSVNRENTVKKRKATKVMKYVVKYLLPMTGYRIFSLSSAEIERHSVTNWGPVALIGAIAGSTVKWSKQFNEMGEPTRNQS